MSSKWTKDQQRGLVLFIKIESSHVLQHWKNNNCIWKWWWICTDENETFKKNRKHGFTKRPCPWCQWLATKGFSTILNTFFYFLCKVSEQSFLRTKLKNFSRKSLQLFNALALIRSAKHWNNYLERWRTYTFWKCYS